MKKYFMSWDEVFKRLGDIKKAVNVKESYLYKTSGNNLKSVYGVPKGGMIIAGFMANSDDWITVTSPSKADLILDDIIDSGRTKEKYSKYNIPFKALIEKEDFKSGKFGDWVVFPWEAEKQDDIEDNLQRLITFYKLDVDFKSFKQTIESVIKIYRNSIMEEINEENYM